MISVLAWNCKKKSTVSDLPDWATVYTVHKPKQFVKMHIPAANPTTEEGIALGRRLFYDPILSADSTFSCANCHQQTLSFTDGKALSVGADKSIGKRSVPSLLNVGFYYDKLFWDGRLRSLEAQVLLSVEDPQELNHNWDAVEAKLRSHPYYPALFERAFATSKPSEIDRNLVAKAIAQFERTLISDNAKYDKVQRGEAEFTAQEQRGWSIFFDASKELPDSECGHCHLDPLFTDLDFSNNGLEEVADLNVLKDKGRGAVTRNYYDNGKFRTPSLRNIALTAPYMHDGRFASLDEVLDHYIKGGHHSENASPNVRKLELNDSHKKDLIAFLHTLTDTSFIQNTAHANPF